jgi:hypothetical protein
MSEQEHNNLPGGKDQEDGRPADEFIPADAKPVCLKCLKPCHPLQNYCDSCNSNDVINPLASYMPFVRIRFWCGFCGDMWRKIWYDKDTLIISRLCYLFMIIMFAPILLIVGLPLFFIGKIKEPHLRKAATIAFWGLIFLLLTAYLIHLFFQSFFSSPYSVPL